jgi:subtilisin family serine protease
MTDRTIPRYTQDSPIRPTVWAEYLNGTQKVPLLISPLRNVSTAQLFRDFKKLEGGPSVIYNQSTVLGKMTFHEMLRYALPASKWWCDVGGHELGRCRSLFSKARDEKRAESLVDLFVDQTSKTGYSQIPSSFLYFLAAIGIVELQFQKDERALSEELAELEGQNIRESIQLCKFLAQRMAEGLERLVTLEVSIPETPSIFAISVNRDASVASLPGARTIKADAARQLFSLDFSKIYWAVLDTGIDVAHPAFENLDEDAPGRRVQRRSASKKKRRRRVDAVRPAPRHRIFETYDFTRLEEIMELAVSPSAADREFLQTRHGIDAELARNLQGDLENGREIDWDIFAAALRVERPERQNDLHPHGTHVAGVLGAGPYESDDDLEMPEERQGMCPNIRLVDIRVLDENGMGSEFQIIAALQYLRHRNANKERPIVQGVNMSLQLLHDVRNYACGQTPLCEEVDRLAGAGIVAVAAAGNMGFGKTGPQVAKHGGGYQDISIMDPGNAESAITVGSTHSEKPHLYGVSFFSGRGPTGDGRPKPDLVAPGEKILGPIPGGATETMDGTSQAAPHVSGAAAMLMARNNELMGQPARIKEILCSSATDLNRERYFQGFGLVDILRAMQSI